MRLTIDTARFAHETIDGETVIIDSVEGRLTVLTGVAAAAWDAIVAGVTDEELLDSAAARFGDEGRDAVSELVADLVDVGLVAATDTDAAPTNGGAVAWPESFVAPGVEHYDDIADIMTMDPIHEVDVRQGWPRPDPS
ncbi:MAG: PqqD family peptide modification chaperone [Actinomycetota bacterium]